MFEWLRRQLGLSSVPASRMPDDGYPRTYPRRIDPEEPPRPEVFDPALKQYPRAFRLGDPVVADPAVKERWENLQLQVMHHLLRLLANSPWNQHLVLRGSLLLKSWLGEVARNPGDIDWVVIPRETSLLDPLTFELFSELLQLVRDHPQAGEAAIDLKAISIDDIWTYERAPGRRIVFPWSSPDVPPGQVQMDFVFGEELWTDPVPSTLTGPDGTTTNVLAASQDLALAWKLVWLETDAYAQGKDLYDATLLAEQISLSLELLHDVLWSALEVTPYRLRPDFPMKWEVDWENFQNEYPQVTGTAREWQNRLTIALAPMFAGEARVWHVKIDPRSIC